jgi:hypothetical protein
MVYRESSRRSKGGGAETERLYPAAMLLLLWRKDVANWVLAMKWVVQELGAIGLTRSEYVVVPTTKQIEQWDDSCSMFG